MIQHAEKIIMPVGECTSGMILMQPVVEEQTGAVIVARGIQLDDQIITKLKKFNHTEIWIKLNTSSLDWKYSSISKKQYESYAKVLYQLLSPKTEMTNIELNELKTLSQTLVKDFKSQYDILSCIDMLSKLETNVYYHSINVALLALVIGRIHGLETEKLENLVLTGLLHDIGKIKLDSSLADKQEEEMTLEEKIAYRRHTIYGYELLVPLKELDIEVLKGVLSHHECMDGTGYPLSLSGDMINDFARIIAVADEFDRLREKNHVFDAIRILGSIRKKKYDSSVLSRFCYNVINYYIGRKVILSNGQVAKVKAVQKQAVYRPVVKAGDEEINLYERTDIEIVDVI